MVEIMKFKDVFLKSVDAFLANYGATGEITAGTNGPHHTPETALRNTCHWIISLSRGFSLTGKEIYKQKAIEIGAALLDATYRPHGFSFHARFGPVVDRCNGLIGQAWAIESLAELTALSGDVRYAQLGVELVKQHKFDRHFGVWRSLDIDGATLNIDNVFNHQLWFCSSAALANRHVQDDEVAERIQIFMDNLADNLTTNRDGLVEHHIARIMSSPRVRLQGLIKHLRQGTIFKRLQKKSPPKHGENASAFARDNGYHAFNTYAFALLKSETHLEHPFWSSNALQRVVSYLSSETLKKSLETSIYGFPYNPPGFEIPFSLEILSGRPIEDVIGEAEFWIRKQVAYSFNASTMLMDLNCEDPYTQAARLYEAARFSDNLFNSELDENTAEFGAI
jgi:hypothetical protein